LAIERAGCSADSRVEGHADRFLSAGRTGDADARCHEMNRSVIDFDPAAQTLFASSFRTGTQSELGAVAMHSMQVSEHPALVGSALGLDAEQTANVRLVGLLHDIGKAAVPPEILFKPAVPDEVPAP